MIRDETFITLLNDVGDVGHILDQQQEPRSHQTFKTIKPSNTSFKTSHNIMASDKSQEQREAEIKETDMVLKEIWDGLKGSWNIARHDFTDVALNGTNVPLDSFVNPSKGLCKMISRSPTDPRYDAEYLKASAVHYRTRPNAVEKSGGSNDSSDSGGPEGDLIGTQGEKFALRLKDGIWSLWDVGGGYNPTCGKVTDFRLKTFREAMIAGHKTYEVVLDASSWNDEYGRNFFQMAFLKGDALIWELRCRFDDNMTHTSRQWLDTCTRVVASQDDAKDEGKTR